MTQARYTVITTVSDYERAIEQLAAGAGPIAVDAERASGFRYSQRAYLIQLFRRGSGVFLFDPPPLVEALGGELTELQAAIVGEEWVLHAASQDLGCLRELGLDPIQIFDTELAARLLGLPKVGLGPLVESLLGIHLAKEHSAADWSTRPLPQSWLEYAALDVELLVDLRDEVERLLVEAGKTEIAAQEFDGELLKPARAERAEPWRRLSGIHAIRGARGLAIARELWLARDELARERDTAPGRLIPDAALTAAVKANPESKKALAELKEFTGRASRSELDRWYAAIEAGRATTELPATRASGGETLPPVRAWSDRNPPADLRYRLAKEKVQAAADELSMPVENLLTPEILRRIAWQPPEQLDAETVAGVLEAAGARPWQIDVTAQMIAESFVDARQQTDDSSESIS